MCLHNCSVLIDEVTLPHLCHLTSLELLYDFRYRHWADHGFQDIWLTFIGSGIQLEELVLNNLDYLFDLKKLDLSVLAFSNRSSSDETATRFFADVLPHHLDTLESLSLKASYEGA